jgi:MFS family permease
LPVENSYYRLKYAFLKIPKRVQPLKSPLFLPWFIISFVIAMLSLSVAFAHFENWQNPLAEDARILWRTIFYILAILLLPLTSLLRHIFLRLNQTMPLLANTHLERVVKTRYTLTVSISMLLMLVIGSFGAMIFYFGDGFRALHILTGIAGLGVFLYRPKLDEYQQILDSLTESEND